MIKIAKIQKRILAFLLIITLLFTSVTMQYKTASADAFAWAATSFTEFAEVASLSLPWGTLVVVLVGLAGGCIAYEYGDDIQATGEQLWADFEKYYIDEWTMTVKQDLKDLNEIKDKSLRQLDEWVEAAAEGCISISSDIWHAFKDFVHSQYYENTIDVTQVPENSLFYRDSIAVYTDVLNGGVVVQEGMTTAIDNVFEHARGEITIKSLECDEAVSMGIVSRFDMYPEKVKAGNTFELGRSCEQLAFWSALPFTITLASNYGEVFLRSVYNDTLNMYFCSSVDTNLSTGFYIYEDTFAHGISDLYQDTRYISKCFYRSLEELIEAVAAIVATDIPMPVDWNDTNIWERADDFDHTADYEDVIVLNPPGINDHAENNKTLEEQVEEAIEMALTNAATWDMAMEILNVLPLDEACENLLENGTPSSEEKEKENEKENENTNKSEVPNADSPSSSGTPYTFSGLEKLFPFCIPFDIYRILNCLDAEPVAPSFKWQFIVYKKKYKISIDLKEWDNVAKTLRNLETISFCVGLALITRSKMLRS